MANRNNNILFANPFGLVIFLIYIIFYVILSIGKFIYDMFKTKEY